MNYEWKEVHDIVDLYSSTINKRMDDSRLSYSRPAKSFISEALFISVAYRFICSTAAGWNSEVTKRRSCRLFRVRW